MWKPNEVVDEHRRWARWVWIVLLVVISAFTILLVVTEVKSRENPSSSYSLSNQRYYFPEVLICISEGRGCDAISTSSATSTSTWGLDDCFSWADHFVDTGDSYATFGDQDPINATRSTMERHNTTDCLVYDLSAFDVGDGEQDPLDTTESELQMVWAAADGAGSSSYSQGVSVYLIDSETRTSSAVTNVPYSRTQYYYDGNWDEAEIHTTHLTIALTEKDYLAKDDMRMFSVSTVATIQTTYMSEDNVMENSTSSTEMLEEELATTEWLILGQVHLNIAQGVMSQTLIEENDPLDVLGLFGNVGGLWELLLMAWGVIFISTFNQRPHLKARDFLGTYKYAKNTISAKTSKIVVGRVAGDGGEVRPDWDVLMTMERGHLSTCTTTQGRLRNDSSLLDATSKRPVERKLPRV